MSCKNEDKPKDIPYYYRSHNITPSPGNDWVCVNGEWIWTVRGIESVQVNIEEKKADNAPYTEPTRDMYGSITYRGKQRIVWCDSVYGDYIAVDGVHYQLRTYWWKSHYNRTHGEAMISKVIPRKSMDKVMNEKRWGLPGLPSLDVKMPSIGLAGKGVIGLIAIVIVIFLALIALGYSGLGGSVGRVAESEHGRRRS